MKRLFMLFGFLAQLFAGKAQITSYEKYPVYNGADLGIVYTPKSTSFRIWSPVAEEAELILYTDGEGGKEISRTKMKKDVQGTWTALLKADAIGTFYTFRTMINGEWKNEVPDPYAKAVGVNGKRAMVVDLKKTNPEGWSSDKSPVFKHKTDAIIYELHVRDASISPSSGIKNKGKFLGLTETGTKNAAGLSTGLDHIKELGVTHVHLLPVFDFNSIDETKPDQRYNWGYDPLNYNVPEGSFATNPYDGVTRIKEFKQLVQTFHKNGLRVVMDVVYNHTALTEESSFNQLVPGYYYRQNEKGGFSNASACGNETASERPMFRKFMLESMKYWVEEYHVDGFRIDLMGIHDIETINLISRELHKIKPDILIYGEGWTAGASPLPETKRAVKANAAQLDRVAVFSDDIRDGIKGSVFDHADKGFASGKPGMEESIKFGIVAGTNHPQVDYTKVNYSKKPWAAQPYQTISYAECHDNHVLWDKLNISAPDNTDAQKRNMHKLALAVVLTSQGISFLHAGTEFLRSKKGVENSFDSPDSINAIDWDLKTTNKDVFDYTRALVKMRKEHPAFRMTTTDMLKKHIRLGTGSCSIISYQLNGLAVKDSWKSIYIVFNGSNAACKKGLPAGQWRSYIKNNTITAKPDNNTYVEIAGPNSCSIYFK